MVLLSFELLRQYHHGINLISEDTILFDDAITIKPFFRILCLHTNEK